jgi:hypothetical protein
MRARNTRLVASPFNPHPGPLPAAEREQRRLARYFTDAAAVFGFTSVMFGFGGCFMPSPR